MRRVITQDYLCKIEDPAWRLLKAAKTVYDFKQKKKKKKVWQAEV
jgi:hypothetical protein